MAELKLYNEAEILKEVEEGKEAAFSMLIDHYSDQLGRFIFQITQRKEVAEEIVQDIFLKIWISRESLAEVRNFRNWLFVLAKNHALNALRSVVKERMIQEQVKLENLQTMQSNDIPTETDHQLSLVDAAIAGLPPQQRKAFLLSRRYGLKHKEIATSMHLSQETVKKYIQYAVQSIHRHVEKALEVSLLLLFLNK